MESVAQIRDAGFSALKIFAPNEEVFAALAGMRGVCCPDPPHHAALSHPYPLLCCPFPIPTVLPALLPLCATCINQVLPPLPHMSRAYKCVDPLFFLHVPGTGMELVQGVYPLNLTTTFALSPGAADRWVEAHVVPWISTVNITTLAVSSRF